MEKADKNIIIRNFIPLSDDMDFDKVSIFLYSKQIFGEDHIEKFAANTTQKKRNGDLLLAIQKRGPEAFGCLVEALLAAEQPYLAEKLGYSPAASHRSANNGESSSSQMDISTSDVPSDEEYKMSSDPKGIAFIINNKNFTESGERNGTDVDCKNLEKIFGDLGFSVTTSRNLKGEEMKGEIQKLSERDHSQYDCMVLAILTHGEEGAVCGTDGGLVMIEDIISLFNADQCPTLKGKPKLFFIQACRGKQKDEGVEAPDGIGPTGDGGTMYDLKQEAQKLLPTEGDSTDGLGSAKCKLPSQSDMLLGYSTVPGFVAWIGNKRGSPFVQGLTEIIEQHAHRGEDLVSMMTKVNQKVSTYKCGKDRRYKQASVCVFTLLKKLYFFPDH